MHNRKTIEVDVTAEDIIKGKEEGCGNCPVAIAISRKLKPKVLPVYVGPFSWTAGNRYAEGVTLPNEVNEWTFRYDESLSPKTSEPVQFTILAPEEWVL